MCSQFDDFNGGLAAYILKVNTFIHIYIYTYTDLIVLRFVYVKNSEIGSLFKNPQCTNIFIDNCLTYNFITFLSDKPETALQENGGHRMVCCCTVHLILPETMLNEDN